ncbi:hypothetical protein BD410DRAFT_809799 [Rickenella mellea]|uniref:F-box domain-containing protein n=1 Tax=Rickenella mellea TaxID=50990 RepID=A0A4Y7PIV6_9AGAM|nr:hypothetical protein BD410DRAFT_809799 [Rickenella mellea]
MLEALELHEQGTYRHYADVDITAAPRLQYLNITSALQLTGISATQSIRQFVLKEMRDRWTSWASSVASPSGILQLLSTSPKLELVDMNVRVGWMRLDRPPRQITSPSLKEVSLHVTQKVHTPEVDIGFILDQLNLPALQILSIDLYSGTSGGMPFSSIQSLVGRSHASLTSLSLIGQCTGLVMLEDDLIDCILHLQDLKSFSLRCMPITNTFINALVPTHRSPGFDRIRVLCPLLDHLTFSASTFTEPRVINMILSRWKDTNHPLRSVHLLSCNLSPSDGAGLQSFGEGEVAKKMGLILEVDDRRA